MAQAATADAAPITPTPEPAPAIEAGKATAALRRIMVERQLRPFDVTDLPVLQRFLDVPREVFLPPELKPIAYSDLAIPGRGAAGAASRGIPAPLVLARFLQGADIRPEHKVLDIAGGAGYSAALLSGLAGQVVALESEPDLAALARENLAKIGATGVRVECGPLEKGVPDAAPFDVILIHGAVEGGLDALFQQLGPNGRLLAFQKLDQDGGLKVLRFERSEGKAAGERALFDATAPLLAAFAKAAGFAF
ncbi:MAG: protein-L-isoaspartate O-methyltransferase [Methylocystis sp.]